jgi:hypothetical protein
MPGNDNRFVRLHGLLPVLQVTLNVARPLATHLLAQYLCRRKSDFDHALAGDLELGTPRILKVHHVAVAAEARVAVVAQAQPTASRFLSHRSMKTAKFRYWNSPEFLKCIPTATAS